MSAKDIADALGIDRPISGFAEDLKAAGVPYSQPHDRFFIELSGPAMFGH